MARIASVSFGEVFMTKQRTADFLLRISLAAALWICTCPSVRAESYVAGQFGVTFPNSLGNVNITTDGLGGIKLNNLDLANSFMGGAKVGHFFSRARWLGVETELFMTTPNVKQQSYVASANGQSINAGQAPGESNRIITWAPMNLVFRYHKTRLQPYVAVGPGLFFARRKDADGGTISGTAIGLNTQLGARYYMTRRWALFGEWKYNLARIGYTNDDSSPTSALGYRATYSANIFSVGISFHF